MTKHRKNCQCCPLSLMSCHHDHGCDHDHHCPPHHHLHQRPHLRLHCYHLCTTSVSLSFLCIMRQNSGNSRKPDPSTSTCVQSTFNFQLSTCVQSTFITESQLCVTLCQLGVKLTHHRAVNSLSCVNLDFFTEHCRHDTACMCYMQSSRKCCYAVTA